MPFQVDDEVVYTGTSIPWRAVVKEVRGGGMYGIQRQGEKQIILASENALQLPQEEPSEVPGVDVGPPQRKRKSDSPYFVK